MDRWKGGVALVTGASSGIGKAIAEKLVNSGMNVVGIARRVEKMEEHAKELTSASGKLYPLKCDVTKEENLMEVFRWIKKNLKGVDVLVNNVGILINSTILGGTTDDWRRMFDVNLLCSAICSREAVKSMRERGIDDGHIININSVTGRTPPLKDNPGMIMLYASKHAGMIQSVGLKQELHLAKSNIRVTNVCPAVVFTEALEALDPSWKKMPTVKPEDVADSVVFALSTPSNIEIQEIVVRNVKDNAI